MISGGDAVVMKSECCGQDNDLGTRDQNSL
jgi:hypothetical protein